MRLDQGVDWGAQAVVWGPVSDGRVVGASVGPAGSRAFSAAAPPPGQARQGRAVAAGKAFGAGGRTDALAGPEPPRRGPADCSGDFPVVPVGVILP